MIDMLSDYSEYMLSKLMLSVVPTMIDNTNDTVLNFYNSAIYKPPLMQEAMIIPWPDDLNELIFASRSSLINSDFLIRKISGKISNFDKIMNKFAKKEQEDKQ